MPPVCRILDVCTGHDCFSPRECDNGSPDVFVNGRNIHRVGDHWVSHGNPPSCVPVHDSVLGGGSEKVFANGIPIGRIGDPIACGSSVATGSPDVYSG